MATKIQLKRGYNAQIASAVLDVGEPAFVIDEKKLYIGDGTGEGTGKILVNPVDKPSGITTGTTFTKYEVNEYGQVISQGNLEAGDITGLLGTAATKDVGTAEGNIPVLIANGKLPESTLPAIAITETFVVANEAEMLALTADKGDIAVRTDENKSYILSQSPATTLANWLELRTPTDAVLSVNGETGAVVLNATEIDMTNYSQPASYSAIGVTDSISEAVGKLEKNFENYATVVSPTLTGVPVAPTVADASASTTQIATTEFVQNATAAAISAIDGGTF